MDNDPSEWFMAELYLTISFLLRVNQPNRHQSIADLLFVSVFRGSQAGRTLYIYTGMACYGRHLASHTTIPRQFEQVNASFLLGIKIIERVIIKNLILIKLTLNLTLAN